MVVNFMHQCRWAMGTRNLTTHYSGSVCEGVFEWVNLWVGRLSKADCPLSVPPSNQLKAWTEQKDWSSLNSSWLTGWDGISVFSCLCVQTETSALLGSAACQRSDWNLHHPLSWVSSLPTNCGSWDFLASIII